MIVNCMAVTLFDVLKLQELYQLHQYHAVNSPYRLSSHLLVCPDPNTDFSSQRNNENERGLKNDTAAAMLNRMRNYSVSILMLNWQITDLSVKMASAYETICLIAKVPPSLLCSWSFIPETLLKISETVSKLARYSHMPALWASLWAARAFKRRLSNHIFMITSSTGQVYHLDQNGMLVPNYVLRQINSTINIGVFEAS